MIPFLLNQSVYDASSFFLFPGRVVAFLLPQLRVLVSVSEDLSSAGRAYELGFFFVYNMNRVPS